MALKEAVVYRLLDCDKAKINIEELSYDRGSFEVMLRLIFLAALLQQLGGKNVGFPGKRRKTPVEWIWYLIL
jgi:hypothetical protein